MILFFLFLGVFTKLQVAEAMAGHDGSGTSGKKDTNDIPTFNAENMQNNMKVIYYRFVFTPWMDVVPC